jgi:hypothetical protein
MVLPEMVVQHRVPVVATAAVVVAIFLVATEILVLLVMPLVVIPGLPVRVLLQVFARQLRVLLALITYPMHRLLQVATASVALAAAAVAAAIWVQIVLVARVAMPTVAVEETVAVAVCRVPVVLVVEALLGFTHQEQVPQGLLSLHSLSPVMQVQVAMVQPDSRVL